MELEITKTMNGFICVEKDNSCRTWSFESPSTLVIWLKDFLPKEAGEEVKLSDE